MHSTVLCITESNVVNPLSTKLDEALERIADLEGRDPGGYIGGVPRSSQRQQGRPTTSVMDSEVIIGFGPFRRRNEGGQRNADHRTVR